MTACVERTEETEAVRQGNIDKKSAAFYHEAFVQMVPEAYWRICELAVRDGFDFDKLVDVSGLDLVEGGIVDEHRSVSLRYRGQIVMHVQQPINIPNACYMNSWTSNKSYTSDMITDALSALNCPHFEEINTLPAFSEFGGRSYVCGDKLLHSVVRETDQGGVAVGIAVERGE